MWLITNKTDINIPGGLFNYSFENYRCLSDSVVESEWIIDGYPKLKKGVKNASTLSHLFDKHEYEFIHYIKGNFAIIKLEKSGFRVYSDRFGIRKFFIWNEGNKFIISDDLKAISDFVDLKPSPMEMAIYALTYHFTGGNTAFKYIKHNQPAEIIHYEEDKISYLKYWDPSQLLEVKKKDIGIKEISDSLTNAVDLNLDEIDQDRISLSLTGGADTRNLLAVFLKRNTQPHLYTYGNPESNDCVKAKSITDELGLIHHIHDIKMDAKTFENYARKIIRLSGGLASIHRTHRLIAVEKEKEFADWMFLGTLGGEFIKGVSEDDYIVPSIVYENWLNEDYDAQWLLKYMKRRNLREVNIPVQELLDFIKGEPYMRGDVTKRKHQALSFITAHLHDAQDINLYESLMSGVFTPFLDIDYLEVLFSSYHTFDQKEEKSNKYLKRLENPVYGSKFLEATYKPLLDFKYSGEHIPKEVLANKYLAAILKIIRQKTNKGYPSNFPLGEWMEDFVKTHLPICNDYPVLKKTFDLDSLNTELNKGNHIPKESYWLKFTNPIMMRFIIEEFA